MLFSRSPFAKSFVKEVKYFICDSKGYLCLICLDLIDKNYNTIILDRDSSKQYRAIDIKIDFDNIEDAEEYLIKRVTEDIGSLKEKIDYFDLFKDLNNEEKQHPHFKLLRDNIGLSAAKEVIQEISYHYKDIDGNFIDQFQTLNGFDARIWELFLFSFFREQFFEFNRVYEYPDFLIFKNGLEIAVEAVIVSRRNFEFSEIEPKTEKEIKKILSNDMPLMFGSALHEKSKKKYWEKPHVEGKPFLIAIADFHDNMSMTWSFSSLSEYLYGYRYEHEYDELGNLIVKPIKVEKYIKQNETEIPSGFFLDENNKYISAIIFTSIGTLSKFNRIGKQAGLGSKDCKLFRFSVFHDHTPNASLPNISIYEVNQESKETFSEGVVIYHNPNAEYPIEFRSMFDDRVSECFWDGEMLKTYVPDIFPYSSFTQNLILKH